MDRGAGQKYRYVDLTDSGLDFSAVSMTEDDVAVISVPAYAGRIPAVVADRLGIVRGNGARTVLVCVYGTARLRTRS